MRYVAEFLRDVRFARRVLARAPSYTATVVLVLAIGIGGNVAVIALANAFLSASPGIEHPERLVALFTSAPNARFGPSSYPDVLDWQKNNNTMEGVLAHALAPISYNHGEGSNLIWGESVTVNYFALLGVRPQLGRFFSADEDRIPGRDPLAVISDVFWRSEFASDPGAIGRPIRLNGATFKIIGVAPRSFQGLIGGPFRERLGPLHDE